MIEIILSIVIAIFGAGGFWELIRWQVDKRLSKKSVEDKAILGLLHNEIYVLCEGYIKKGSVTVDEYDNLQYLYKPYKELGGNGTAKRLMEEVDRLHLKGKQNEDD